MNRVQLEGTLSKGNKFRGVRYTPGGSSMVCDFQIKVVETKANGQVATQWISCYVWGEKAEEVARTEDGAKVRFSGRIDNQSWVDKQTGQKVYKTKFEAEELWLESRADKVVAAARQVQQQRANGNQPDTDQGDY